MLFATFFYKARQGTDFYSMKVKLKNTIWFKRSNHYMISSFIFVVNCKRNKTFDLSKA